MPEPAAWRYQKIQKPIFDLPAPERLFINARVLTCVDDQIIDPGFVHVKDGKLVAVGPMSDMPRTEGHVT